MNGDALLATNMRRKPTQLRPTVGLESARWVNNCPPVDPKSYCQADLDSTNRSSLSLSGLTGPTVT